MGITLNGNITKRSCDSQCLGPVMTMAEPEFFHPAGRKKYPALQNGTIENTFLQHYQ